MALLARVNRKLATKKLHFYRPYPKQLAFHKGGASHRHRLFLAGNQLGKTLAGAAEAAMHATGRYPDWWPGRRWDRPTIGWIAGVTGETTRDNPQKMLMGRPEHWGTGMLEPGDIIEPTRAMGVTDLLDNVRVRHVSGGESLLFFKFYEKGREKWQGETIDFVWFDEEPPPDIYSEGKTRRQATDGMTYISATPLKGMTEVVGYFYPVPEKSGLHLTQMTIDDAEHYTPEQRAEIIEDYAEYEREARAQGIPMLGSGRVFPVAESLIKVDAFEIPDLWPRLGAMDFGWEHPFAAVDLAHDRDSDVIYVTKAYRVKQQTPVFHAAALKPWGDWLPWSWPRDGKRQTLEGAGLALAKQYGDQGLDMLSKHAQFEDGSVSVEAGLIEMLDRMQTGRLKVFGHLEDWFTEFRAYHRKDGMVVKEREDLMSATRYGIMMLRYASTKPRPSKPREHARVGAGGWMSS